MCCTLSTSTVTIVITKSAAGVNRAVHNRAQRRPSPLNDSQARSQPSSTHGPTLASKPPARDQAQVQLRWSWPHYLQISHLGYQRSQRVENDHGTPALDHTYPSSLQNVVINPRSAGRRDRNRRLIAYSLCHTSIMVK